MVSSDCNRDIVLFIGAGFSSDAGLPIMKCFGQESEKDYKGLSEHIPPKSGSKPNRNAANMLIEAAKVFYDFQKFCKPAIGSGDSDVNNLETIFCIAEAIKEANQTEIKLNGQSYLVEALIEKIQLWLWKVYQQCPLLNHQRKTNKSPYQKFFSRLKEINIVNRLTVISTNYDLIYEYFSWQYDLPCVYSLPNAKDIKAGYGSKSYVYCGGTDKYINKVLLCKLHGSVNYFFKRHKENELFVATDVGNSQRIGQSGVWKDKPAIFAVDAIWNIREQDKTFTPAIIPPTYAKLSGYSWLKDIWETAFNALVQAKKIIFIGYGMPESDGFMRALIQGARAVRDDKHGLQVYVIDPLTETHKQYKELFGSIYQPVSPQRFREGIETISNILVT